MFLPAIQKYLQMKQEKEGRCHHVKKDTRFGQAGELVNYRRALGLLRVPHLRGMLFIL